MLCISKETNSSLITNFTTFKGNKKKWNLIYCFIRTSCHTHYILDLKILLIILKVIDFYYLKALHKFFLIGIKIKYWKFIAFFLKSWKNNVGWNMGNKFIVLLQIKLIVLAMGWRNNLIKKKNYKHIILWPYIFWILRLKRGLEIK